MTKNQIDYWRYREDQRHNQASEKEENRSNLAKEGENYRHNTSTEKETHRHNVATEGIDISKLNETQRHNKETEALGKGNLQLGRDTLNESRRHNVATESEANRHNVATEGISIGNLNESIRHNMAAESLGYGNLSLGQDTLSETNRHNVVSEGISSSATEANNTLAYARARLSDTERNWKVVLNDQQTDINAATLDKIEAEISKLQNDVEVSREKVTQGYVDQLIKSIELLNKQILSLGG